MSVKFSRQSAPRDSTPGTQTGSNLASAPAKNADRQIALLLFALTLALYLRGTARDILPGDAGEFQFAAWNFGLAHATGYPLYLIVGGIWQRLLGVLGINPAQALNILSALFGATTVALFYTVIVRWLPGGLLIRRAAAVVAAAWLATNPTFWSQALIAEVYTLHALFLVLILLCLQRIEQAQRGTASPVWLALVAGLSLTHHATTLLLLPALAAVLWLWRDRFPIGRSAWMQAALAGLLPLLLYLYVPLRLTPAASPWYFPRIGAETLALLAPRFGGMFDFMSGRSISVGFAGVDEAWGALPGAFTLWRIHFGWVGFVLMLLGGYAMWSRGRRGLLAFTLIAALTFQLFNLFYAIEDILVYYIPLYVIGVLWVGFGAALLGAGFVELAQSSADTQAASERPVNWNLIGVLIISVLLFFPLRQASSYMAGLNQATSRQARQMWEAVLAAEPAQNAILVSNDRNEIVPLYYMQYVDNRRSDLTGLFPLIAPEARFADVGATIQTALASGAPVYLVKPMPGLETRFALQPAGEPLLRVVGDAAAGASPTVVLDQAYAGLTLWGIDVTLADQAAGTSTESGDSLLVRLYWRVDQGVPAAYTTTVQAYDAEGNRVAQSDVAAGGLYYPTSLWKPGEVLIEEHTLQLASGSGAPASLLVGMYSGPALDQLAPPLLIDLGAIEGVIE